MPWGKHREDEGVDPAVLVRKRVAADFDASPAGRAHKVKRRTVGPKVEKSDTSIVDTILEINLKIITISPLQQREVNMYQPLINCSNMAHVV